MEKMITDTPTSEGKTALSCVLRTHRTPVSYAPQETYVVSTISANGKSFTRISAGFAVVIDVSGSMCEDGKIKLLKTNLLSFVRMLSAEDYFSLISYSSGAKTLIEPCQMTNENKQKAINIILEDIIADGQTNLSKGILHGIKSIKKIYESQNEKERKMPLVMLLMTDGHINMGQTKKLIADWVDWQRESFDKYVIHTFGYGEGHDGDVLKAISNVGRGDYYDIRNNTDITSIYSLCLGGVVSTVATYLTIEVEYIGEIGYAEVLGQKQVQKCADKIIVNYNDIYYGESKDILVKLVLTEGGHYANTSVKFTIKYIDTATGNPIALNDSIDIKRKYVILESIIDKHTDIQINRVQTILAIEQANKCTELEEFRKVIRQQISSIRKSISGESKLCMVMIKELKELLVPHRIDNAKHITGPLASSHTSQRALSKGSCYKTSTQEKAVTGLL